MLVTFYPLHVLLYFSFLHDDYCVCSLGQVPACMMIETIMEHLALEAKRSPVIFRELNLFEEGQVGMPIIGLFTN